jgi:hypothetical protein
MHASSLARSRRRAAAAGIVISGALAALAAPESAPAADGFGAPAPGAPVVAPAPDIRSPDIPSPWPWRTG